MQVTVDLDTDTFIALVQETPDGGNVSDTIVGRLRLGGWRKVNTGRCFGNSRTTIPGETTWTPPNL